MAIVEAPAYQHVVGGIAIDCDIELPGLPRHAAAVDRPARGLRITVTAVELLDPALGESLWNRHSDGWRYTTATAQFDIADGGLSVTVGHLADANRAELQRLLVDHVIPRALVVAGHTVLHATAVACHGAALAFIGASGAGKSTMAMHFVNHGATLLADDALIIERNEHGDALVVPTQRVGRLWPDSAAALALHPSGVDDRAKHWVALDTVEHNVPLAAVISLQRGEHGDPTMQRSGAVDALWALSRQTFGGQMNGLATADLLKPLRWMAEQIPVFSLSYPSNFEGLDRTRQCIIECLAQQHEGR
jgi:hypothetical protein